VKHHWKRQLNVIFGEKSLRETEIESAQSP